MLHRDEAVVALPVDATESTERGPVPMPLLVSVEEAARIRAVGRTTIYELIAAGDLEAIHVGRCRRVPFAALHTFVQNRRAARD